MKTNNGRTYLVGCACGILGMIAGGIINSALYTKLANPSDVMVEYVSIHAAALKNVHSVPPEGNGALNRLWWSAGTYVGIAGLEYASFSNRAQQELVRNVKEIDKVAPYFRTGKWHDMPEAERWAATRACILAPYTNAADVVACVRSVKSMEYVADAKTATRLVASRVR